jgi:hypothetical protein
MASIASFEASGDCSLGASDCIPTGDAGIGECSRLVNVTGPSAGVTASCHLRVTSTQGRVFAQDLSFTVNLGGPCATLFPPTVNVTASFGDAGVSDGAPSDAPGGG